LLGGKDNYAVDRAAVEATLKVWPDMAFAAAQTVVRRRWSRLA
jgi:S-adenosyl methyltransferase